MKVVVSQHVASAHSVVQQFYSDVSNLKRISPAFPRLTINAVDTCVVAGRTFQLSLDFLLFKFEWLSKIDTVVEGEYFVDIFQGSIFKQWHHTHRYKSSGIGTLLTDEIEYVPVAWFAPFAYLAVRLLFVFRKQAIAKVLG